MANLYTWMMFFLHSSSVLYFTLVTAFSVLVAIYQPTWLAFSVLAVLIIKSNSLMSSCASLLEGFFGLLSQKYAFKSALQGAGLEKLNYPEKAKEEPKFDFESLAVEGLKINYDEKEINFGNLEINKGDRVLLIGPSGCGKSSLVKLLSGLLTSDQEFLLNNQKDDLNKLSNEIFLTESQHTFLKDSIMNNLTLFDDNKVAKAKELVAEFNLSNLDLEQDLTEVENKFSQGEGQRLMIIRALLSDKDFLIFDETFSNIDDQNTELLIEKLKDLNKTLIVVSHTLQPELHDKFNKVWKLEQGGICAL
ncbi:ATP-binding cassette domain-containing protein [Mycoplasma hafezii]|uniref:ATP-binding cassette domain-containing protein n=1 Tax=Mycoplasma hafezii TaxID=525886 RepID=UPI003CEAFD94